MNEITEADIALANLTLTYALWRGWEPDCNGNLTSTQQREAMKYIQRTQPNTRGWMREQQMAEEEKEDNLWTEILEIEDRDQTFKLRTWDDIEIRTALAQCGQEEDAADKEEDADSTYRRWKSRMMKWEGKKALDQTKWAKKISEVKIHVSISAEESQEEEELPTSKRSQKSDKPSPRKTHAISINVARFIAKIHLEWGSSRGNISDGIRKKIDTTRQDLQRQLAKHEIGHLQIQDGHKDEWLVVRKIR